MAQHNHTPLNALKRRPTLPLARALWPILSILVLAAGPVASPPAAPRVFINYGVIEQYPDPSPAINEGFGNTLSLAASGNQLVVAAQGDRLGGATPVGAVYVLTTSTGLIGRTITETTPGVDDEFGHSIAVSGTVSGTNVLVGAPLRDSLVFSNTGSAYLFDMSSGSLVQSFSEPSAAAQNKFGSAVAIISNTAVLIGVPYYDSGNPAVGRAYICQIADGSCSTPIDSPSDKENGHFGLSVIALGDYFAIAAPQDGDQSHGIVYVYTTTSGLLYKTIPSPSLGDYFGSALAAVNGNLLVGAQNGGPNVLNIPGAAYLFSPSGALLHTFNDPDAADNGALFGAAVAGDGNVVLIGAPLATAAEFGDGRAYLFDATNGSLIDRLQEPTPAAGNHFGNAVDMLGESFIIGAPDDRLGAPGAGVVYRFGPTPASFATSSKSVSATTVRAGDLFTYTLTLANTGTFSATYSLTDTLDSHLVVVSAPGLSGSSPLTATGILTGGAQLSFQIALHSIQPFSAIVANVAQLSGDGSLRNLAAPLVHIGYQLFMPILRR